MESDEPQPETAEGHQPKQGYLISTVTDLGSARGIAVHFTF